MQLLSILLGSPVTSVNPEVDSSVTSLAGELQIGESSFSVVRRLVQTDTAIVQVAGYGVAQSLPASRPTKQEELTFGRWLLRELGLPDLRVPEAPTRPEESGTTPVSIADYISYCRLRQDEIDVDVLGSSKPFRDIKRRYVFRILFGSYDAETAQLQQALRGLETELRGLQQAETSFSRFLVGTALENRAALETQLASAKERIDETLAEQRRLAAQARSSPPVAMLITRIEDADRQLGQLESEMKAELVSAEELAEFINQLETQSARLTRAVVAGGLLHDFDSSFVLGATTAFQVTEARTIPAIYAYKRCMPKLGGKTYSPSKLAFRPKSTRRDNLSRITRSAPPAYESNPVNLPGFDLRLVGSWMNS